MNGRITIETIEPDDRIRLCYRFWDKEHAHAIVSASFEPERLGDPYYIAYVLERFSHEIIGFSRKIKARASE